MFLIFFETLKKIFSGFNVIQYITFRSAFSAVTTFLIAMFCMPFLIKKLKSKNIVDMNEREYCSSLNVLHKDKRGTPTMGGIIIIFSFLVSILFWGNLQNPYVWLVIVSVLVMGILGFIDDNLKIKNKSNKALSIRSKLIVQILFALAVGTYLYIHPTHPVYGTYLQFPFFKHLLFDMGIYYIPFVVCVILATSNAVNVTDGLDGLAVGSIMICMGAYAVISYLTGHIEFANYLQIIPIAGSGELTVCSIALVGASLAFLWFNAKPAQIFMGDVGSLPLGTVVGVVALITKQELLLILVGGVFVMEILSVAIQIISYKIWHKRIFKMAPIHHHFERLGWPETQIIVRFWIIGIILALLSLSTLKLR
ncbi:MAG: phospho-N-acetylmuramoyl-pentapeptide-transferase [Candidatus Ratteibacteria bacterium]|nr:phospho-N-acetylmuramoyl-pentapeptide-transferase [Candidatus Ratteibacteria bacterium]